MFGVLRGCGKHLDRVQHQEWWSHICGLCLTLRDQHGQLSRVTTNYDAALLSVLYEAQADATLPRGSNVCALRRFRRADVVNSEQVGARYAAGVALLVAGTRVNDQLADGDTWLRHVPGLSQRVGQHWSTHGRHDVAELGFDPALIEDQTGRQAGVEQLHHSDFTTYAEPTELAVGAAFRHTAVLAGRPENSAPLEQIGRMYGRMMFLLDSYRDYAADQQQQVFNALARCFSPDTLQSQARSIFTAAHASLKAQFEQLTLTRAELAHTLLVAQLFTTGIHTINAFDPGSPLEPGRVTERAARERWYEGCGDCCGSCCSSDDIGDAGCGCCCDGGCGCCCDSGCDCCSCDGG